MATIRKRKAPDGHAGWAVVTGASSGLGKALAKDLSAAGYPVLLVARRRERLERLRRELEGPSDMLVLDLTERKSVETLCAWMEHVTVSVFVNNAGFGLVGSFDKTDPEVEMNMIRLQVEAVHLLSKAAIRRMEAADGGVLLNVASSAGLLPAGPWMSGYYACKSYVASLTQALATECRMRGSPVRIFCLCPGPVRTEFDRVALVKNSRPGISAQRCADYAMRAMHGHRVLIIPGFCVRLGLLIARLTPRGLMNRLTGWFQRRKL